MKKVKVLLSAVAVVAVVAGAIASQARENSVIYTGAAKNACNVRTPAATLVNPTLVGGVFATLATNGLCPDKYITTIAPN